MKIVTGKMMKEADRKAIEEAGVPSLLLMEHAGLGVLKEVEKLLGTCSQKIVSIVAGKGNNGGDGFVVARHLLKKGSIPKVFLAVDPDQIKGDAKVNLSLFEQWGGQISTVTSGNLRAVKKELGESHLIVDALFGTGLSSPLEGLVAQLVRFINGLNLLVVAIDIPSGIHSDSGQVLGVAIKARVTATMGLPKQGCYFFPGAEYTGELKIVDIGIPPSVLEQINSSFQVITRDQVASLLPKRPMKSHKGLFGHVAIVAGARNTTGASLLTSLAALRSGAGLVTLAIPASIHSIVAAHLLEVMSYPLPETQKQTLSTKAEEPILSLLKGKRSLALGPGISTHPETHELIHRILPQLTVPTVLDADALNALSGHLGLLKQCQVPMILTPHPGEMGRLLGITAAEVEADRLGSVEKLARLSGQYIVLKGAKTLVRGPHGETYLNPTGNPGMATAGIGDALTGVIAGLLAQGLSPLDSAIAGTFIHGLAGDFALKEKGARGLITRDLIEQLPVAFRELE